MLTNIALMQKSDILWIEITGYFKFLNILVPFPGIAVVAVKSTMPGCQLEPPNLSKPENQLSSEQQSRKQLSFRPEPTARDFDFIR